MAFKLGSLRFLDSMQFMKSGLDKLASNLGAEDCKEITRKDGTKLSCTKPGHLWRIDSGRCFAHPENFKITSKHVPPKLLEIYLKKGVYPYEFMNSWEKFFKIQLPQREHSIASSITRAPHGSGQTPYLTRSIGSGWVTGQNRSDGS